ncbi:MAG: putative Ig domain-containing protein [Ilumatobacteraceae bacterium]
MSTPVRPILLSSATRADRGLTLIELVIAITLSLMIGGVVVAGLITSLNVASSTSAQISESTDAGLISSFLVRDAQSAGGIDPTTAMSDNDLGVSTDASDDDGIACAPAPAVLALRLSWIDRSTSPTTKVVATYATSPDPADTTKQHFVRRLCSYKGATASAVDVVLGRSVFTASVTCQPLPVAPAVHCGGHPMTVELTVTGKGTKRPLVSIITASLRATASQLTISGPAEVPLGEVDVAYPANTRFATIGATAPSTWTGLPSGLTIDSDGLIQTPTAAQAGTFSNVTVTVTDSLGATATKNYASMTIQSKFTVAWSPLPDSHTGATYSSTSGTGSGGTTQYGWSASGTLPTGLSIDPTTGVVSGTPSAAGRFNFTVIATDAMNATASFGYTLTVTDLGLGIFSGHQDIGGTGRRGDSRYVDPTYTAEVGKGDIGGKNDQFQYMYTPMTGDGRMTARIASQNSNDKDAQAGVMFRETLSADSTFAMVGITESSGGQFVYRDGAGTTAIVSSNPSPRAPYWVRLTRLGNLFTAERSADGVTWTSVDQHTISMGSTIFVGLGVSTHNNAGKLGVATFDNVSITAVKDTVSPSVTGVSSTTIDGSYKAGVVIPVTVTFSEPVTVTGLPQLTLSTGSPATTAVNYTSGSGSSTLTFNYTVAAGNTSTNLNYPLTTSLTLNGGTIQDLATNGASLALPAPTAATSLGVSKSIVVDTAAPTISTLTMSDANGNGRVDTVTVAFSEPIATSTATTPPWTLTNVPSLGTLASVAVSGGNTATLTITEGAGVADTSVGTFKVALAATSTGIYDAAGNQASFAAVAPADKAKPVPMTITDTNGTTDGKIQSGNKLLITFSEPLLAASVPASTTMVVTGTTPSDTLSMTGVSNGAGATGGTNYVTTASTASFASTVALSSATITVTVGACTGTGCAALGTQSTAATYSYVAAATLTDSAGNAASQVPKTVNLRLF